MATFAIAAEGYTDQVVLRHVLEGFFEDEDALDVRFVQPDIDATGAHGDPAPGGFDQVIKYLKHGRYRDALQLNDYLVLHIDTDCAEQYGVARHRDGRELGPYELLFDVALKLLEHIPIEVQETHGHRILFAAGFDSIECWLLPLVFDRSQKKTLTKTTGCLPAIDHKRQSANEKPLANADGTKNPEVYKRVSKPFQKRKTVVECARHNPGFEDFVAQLERTGRSA